MSYSVSPIEWTQADHFLKIAKFAFRAPYLQIVTFVDDSNAC
jgi:hypothetical protein